MVDLIGKMIFAGCFYSVDFIDAVWQIFQWSPCDEHIVIVRRLNEPCKITGENKSVIFIKENNGLCILFNVCLPILFCSIIYNTLNIGLKANTTALP